MPSKSESRCSGGGRSKLRKHLPPLQRSPTEQVVGPPRKQSEPLGARRWLQRPVAGSHSGSVHCGAVGHVTGVPGTHTVPWQTSPVSQPFPSSQAAPSPREAQVSKRTAPPEPSVQTSKRGGPTGLRS